MPKTLLPLLVLLALLLAPTPAASAPLFADYHLPATDNGLPPPIPPEPYPFSDRYPVLIALPDTASLQALYSLNLDLDGLQATSGSVALATAYVDPTEAATLTRLGFDFVPIPNEGYRSFLDYGPGSGSPDAWPSFDEYVIRMQALETAHPEIVDLVIIGYSVQNRPLYCLEITDNPGVDENEPEFKYTANHHGDETTGVELTMRLAELLANSYGSDPTLTNLVNEMEIWLCPIYNPDGYVAGTRYNAHGQDLNRDFPDRFTDPIDDPAGREPETQAFMNFGYAHRFVMGANYHGGAQVLNYPWDAIADEFNPEYAPDDQLFYDFGYGYTQRNTDLWNGGWPNGITRGWEWYMIYGGMQDWAYFYQGEHHVTLEISNNKSPAYNLMNDYWDRNRDAMLWWMSQSLTGFHGLVLDARNSSPLNATVTVNGMAMPNFARTDPDLGDYHRVILPGYYTLTASADGFISQSAAISVISGTVVMQDFYLLPLPDLTPSSKTVSASLALPGDLVFYQVNVVTTGSPANAILTDTLPTGLEWSGYLTATLGTPSYLDGQIFWQGLADPLQPVTITYGVSLTQCLPAGFNLLNLAELSDSESGVITRTAAITVENALPSLPANPFPVNGAVNQSLALTLAWDPSLDLNCDAISYDLYFGLDNPPPLLASTSDASYDPGPLLPGVTYFWSVTAHDGIGQIASPVWSFTTGLSWQLFLPLVIR
jgi:uncharacterized repeat protein (TIGR01451 family)